MKTSKIVPVLSEVGSRQESIKKEKVYDFVNYLLLFNEPVKLATYLKFQEENASFIRGTLLYIIFSVYVIPTNIGIVQYHYSPMAVANLILAIMTVIIGTKKIIFKTCGTEESKSLLPVLRSCWVVGINVTLCFGLLFSAFQPINEQNCKTGNYMNDSGCGFDNHAIPDIFMACLLIVPVVISMIVGGIRYDIQMGCWLLNALTIAFCIVHFKLYASLTCFCIMVPGSFFLLYSYQLQSLQLFLASDSQYTIMLEKERKAEQEHLAEMKSLIGNMAHDLKTPLAGFVSGIETVSLLIQELTNDIQNPHVCKTKTLQSLDSIANTLGFITHTNSFMLMTINRCIDFTKANNGVKLQPRLETINLLEVISMPVTCMRDMQNRISIILHTIPSDICDHIITDKQWLQENLLCLLSNAVKYSNSGDVDVVISLEEFDHMDPTLTPDTCDTTFSHMSVHQAPSNSYQMHTTNHQQQQKQQQQYNQSVLTFEVSDNGVGLDEEVMQTLFAPFKQAQRFAGGTGLGLYSLAKRIEALKGTYGVRYRSDGKQGSVFWFSIPYRPSKMINDSAFMSRVASGITTSPPATERPLHTIPLIESHESLVSNAGFLVSTTKFTPQGNDTSTVRLAQQSFSQDTDTVNMMQSTSSVTTPIEFPKLNILLVDDALSILKMTTMLLKRKGHTVHTAENGAEALLKLTESYNSSNSEAVRYDVVLMDIQMPVMDGLEATKRWRKTEQRMQSTLYLGQHASFQAVPGVGTNGKQFTNCYITSHTPSPKVASNSAMVNSDKNKFFTEEMISLSVSTDLAPISKQLIIGLSANSDHDTVLAACAAGIDAFIPKPLNMDAFQETYLALTKKVN